MLEGNAETIGFVIVGAATCRPHIELPKYVV